MAVNYFPGTNIARMNNRAGVYMRLAGMRQVRDNLNREISNMKKRTVAGLKMAAAKLQYNMETYEPLVPVDTGVLHNSWRVVDHNNSPENPQIKIGYTANYAAYVHEMTQPPYGVVKWTRQGSRAKWFEIHLDTDKKEMLDIIADEASVK